MDTQMIRLPAWKEMPNIGLYMDQVLVIMDRLFAFKMPKGELTKAMINNYVKAGLLPRPVKKKYEREHLAILIMLYIFKQSLDMETVDALIKQLCKDGTQQGYERFCQLTEELEHAVMLDRVELDLSSDTREDSLLRLGLMSSLCSVRIHWMLYGENQAGKTAESGKGAKE
ncbi:MAG: DUF1836 domain-containing protein [Clostridia bacterium]|nr:DUF1836 domain-containing protein [Clostridia bacterium]